MSFEFFGIVESKKIEEKPITFIKDVANILKKYKDLKQKLTPQVCYFLAYYFFHLFKPEVYNEIERKNIEEVMYVFTQINNKTRGTFMNFSMNQKYIQFMPQLKKQMIKQKLNIDVLNIMKFWIREFYFIKRDLGKNKKVDVFRRVQEFICKKNQFTQTQDKILVMNYIYTDLVNVFPTFIIKLKQKIPKEQLFNIQSLINLINIILPKTMFRIEMDLPSFPQNIVEMPKISKFPLIYINEALETLMLCCHFYLTLLKTFFTALISHMNQLQDIQQQKIMQLVFRFYYVNHDSQSETFVLDCLKYITNAVRFAAAQKIIQFIDILLQINMKEFVERIFTELNWTKQLKQKLQLNPTPKNQIDALSNVYIELNVPRGAKQYRYIEIYREFSLVYFDIVCKSADINVKFTYVGSFYDKLESNSLIFQKQRLKTGQFFKGSIEILNPGIYCFQFDNSYSWITSKSINFKFSILASLDISYRNYRSEYMKIYLSQIRGYSKNKYIIIKGQREEQDIGQIDNQHFCENIFRPPLFAIKITHKRTNIKYQYEFESNDQQNIRQKIIEKITKYIKENKVEYLVYNRGNQLKRIDKEDIETWITQSLKKLYSQKNNIYDIALKEDELESMKNPYKQKDQNNQSKQEIQNKKIKQKDKNQNVAPIVVVQQLQTLETKEIPNKNLQNVERIDNSIQTNYQILSKPIENIQKQEIVIKQKVLPQSENQQQNIHKQLQNKEPPISEENSQIKIAQNKNKNQQQQL